MRVGFLFAVSFFLFLKSSYLFVVQIDMVFKLFAILQKYEFSSTLSGMLCRAWLFAILQKYEFSRDRRMAIRCYQLFAILQKYEFSSKSQQKPPSQCSPLCCLRYCKSTSFQANHNHVVSMAKSSALFAILQKYEFSSKSQQAIVRLYAKFRCLRYCKSTSFQANHNSKAARNAFQHVVCDTAKVRVFKQITTPTIMFPCVVRLFAILQKYEFSSKSQHPRVCSLAHSCCLRYCKSTSFQANHNDHQMESVRRAVVCDTAKVRVFKQITTGFA